MTPETQTPTVGEIAPPLVDLLNRKYPTGDDEEYQSLGFDRFDMLGFRDNRVVIELPDNVTANDKAMRAVATLLHVTGSEALWVSDLPCEGNPLGGPLRFSLMKQAAWAGYFWMWSRYLIVDHLSDELDTEAAAGQVALLVAHLAEPANLIDLGPEEQALF